MRKRVQDRKQAHTQAMGTLHITCAGKQDCILSNLAVGPAASTLAAQYQNIHIQGESHM